jgi:hypothetical protein
MTESSEQLVTGICLVVQPRYEKVVMTQSEFETFNKEFQETHPIEMMSHRLLEIQQSNDPDVIHNTAPWYAETDEYEEDLPRKYKFVDWNMVLLVLNWMLIAIDF